MKVKMAHDELLSFLQQLAATAAGLAKKLKYGHLPARAAEKLAGRASSIAADVQRLKVDLQHALVAGEQLKNR
jgi:hypothetical protein